MNERKFKVRMQMQRIIGFLFLIIAVLCCVIIYSPGNPEDMSGAIIPALLGIFLIFSKKYMFLS